MLKKIHLYSYNATTGEFTVENDYVLSRMYTDNELIQTHAVGTKPNQRTTRVANTEGKVYANPYQHIFTIWYYSPTDSIAREKIKSYCSDLYGQELKTLNQRKSALESMLLSLESLVSE